MNGRIERGVAIIAIVTFIVAGILGIKREAGLIINNVESVVPEGYRAESSGEYRFNVVDNNTGLLSYYIAIEHSNGFGGKMDLAVLVDTTGSIRDLEVIDHRETPSYLEKVKKKGLPTSLKGKKYSDPFKDKIDIDVISGATYTSNAIINCTRVASRVIASENLNFEVPEEDTPRIIIGIPEIALLILYIIAFIGIYSGLKKKKLLRWLTMLGGLIVLGFWFAIPLSLSKFNTFILGFWPDWHNNLYWYMLVFGFVITVLTTRKNIYCNWICPVGCIQDSLGLVGDAKPRFSKRINRIITWFSRIIAWLAIVLALYFRNPVKLNYEIFGVAVNLTGASYLFVITGIFLVASVFIKRPWCNYLCPVSPIYDFLKLFSPEKISKNRTKSSL